MNSTPTATKRRDWGRLIVWAPLLIGGVVVAAVTAAVASSRRRPQRARLSRALQRLLSEDEPTDLTQHELRTAIIGNDKQMIVAAFGPPRTAMKRGIGVAAAAPRQYFAADTWYYPFDNDEKTAVVIEFDRGIASRAEIIAAPRRTSSSS